MKFARLPLPETEGCILAHTLKAGGIVFVRGRRLTADDLRILADHGATELAVARLEPGDVDQGTAASRIAELLCGAGLRVSEPLQGRCRLIAEAAGLLRLDPGRVDNLNGVAEGILLSTLNPHEAVKAGETVATLRVMPFALPEEVVRGCLDRLAGRPILDLAEYRPFRAALILIRNPIITQAQLDNWTTLVSDNLAAFGGALAEQRVASIDEATLAERLSDADPAADIVLIAGPTSTIQRDDPVPTTIEALGGTILRLGVPSDPGSQVLWASLDGRPVVGLPACGQPARLRGFDLLLRRFAAGLNISATAIANLGVGGFQRGHQIDDDEDFPVPAGEPPRIAALVLAASRSPNRGDTTRLLTAVDGEPLIRRAVRTALGARPRPVIVVLAAEDAELVGNALLGLDEVQLVVAPAPLATIGEIVDVGLTALPANAEAAIFQPADMPFLRGDDIDALVAAFDGRPDAALCQPTFRGHRGYPILCGRRYFAEIAGRSGGLDQVLSTHHDRIVEVETDHPGVLMDLDTLESLSSWSATA